MFLNIFTPLEHLCEKATWTEFICAEKGDLELFAGFSFMGKCPEMTEVNHKQRWEGRENQGFDSCHIITTLNLELTPFLMSGERKIF